TAGPACENSTSGSPNCASSAAIVRSQNIASSQPPPSAWPCTEAITGLRSVQGVIRQRKLVLRRAWYLSASCRQGCSPPPPPTSKPTQKLRPAPRNTITLVAASSSARLRTCSSASLISIDNALSLSGRFSVTMPTLPSASYRTRSAAIVIAHCARPRQVWHPVLNSIALGPGFPFSRERTDRPVRQFHA